MLFWLWIFRISYFLSMGGYIVRNVDVVMVVFYFCVNVLQIEFILWLSTLKFTVESMCFWINKHSRTSRFSLFCPIVKICGLSKSTWLFKRKTCDEKLYHNNFSSSSDSCFYVLDSLFQPFSRLSHVTFLTLMQFNL